MNVKLAAQTLSSSVADSLKFCEKELRLPQVQGAGQRVSLFDYLVSSLTC